MPANHEDALQRQDGGAEDSSKPSSSSPNTIQHMPRKRASAPGFTVAGMEPEQMVSSRLPRVPAPPGTIMHLREQRYGPTFVSYGCYAGAVAVAYTYLNGFMHLAKNNRPGWAATFRHRLIILGPLLAMYACGNGVVPMPFKRHFEHMLGRPALSTIDVYDARDRLVIQKQQQQAAQAAASDSG